jgi:hypothetical protein
VASQSTTVNEESGKLSVMMIYNNGSHANRSQQTWYPTAARVGKCQASIDVSPNASGKGALIPLSLEVYWTAGTTAERYLGSVTLWENAATTITVPYEYGSAGNIRLHTVGWTTTPGQYESSQFSRTVPIGAAKCVSSVDIKVQAWNHVSSGATSYDEVIHAHEIPSPATQALNTTVWWTYTVTNDGDAPLKDLSVTDTATASELSTPQEVCFIPSLPAGASHGCVTHSKLTM